MPEDVKVPGIGEVPKKYLLWGGVAAAGIAAVFIIRSRSAASSATAGTAADTTGTAADTSGTGSGYYDSTAGAGYGQDYGGGGAFGYNGVPTGYDSAGYPVGSQADLQWQSGLGSTSPASGITTNDQWIAQAMSNVPGNSETIHAALAAVLGGLTVSTEQKNLFLEAVGINGEPPQGYPKPIHTKDTPQHPGGQGQKVKVPVVTGETIPDAQRELAAVGLRAKVSGTIPHGKTGLAKTQSPRGGTVVARNSVVRLTGKAE